MVSSFNLLWVNFRDLSNILKYSDNFSSLWIFLKFLRFLSFSIFYVKMRLVVVKRGFTCCILSKLNLPYPSDHKILLFVAKCWILDSNPPVWLRMYAEYFCSKVELNFIEVFSFKKVPFLLWHLPTYQQAFVRLKCFSGVGGVWFDWLSPGRYI